LTAGLLVYRRRDAGLEVLLVHPGGPFRAKRDAASWSIPKGECADGEDAERAAGREFREELGHEPPPGPWLALGDARLSSGKVARIWGVEGDLDADAIESNTFELEWPRGTGRVGVFPEVDRASWETVAGARTRLVTSQVVFLDRLLDALDAGGGARRSV
jgi:predicted NUDIX family NTP pyrophosphohydrolase